MNLEELAKCMDEMAQYADPYLCVAAAAACRELADTRSRFEDENEAVWMAATDAALAACGEWKA